MDRKNDQEYSEVKFEILYCIDNNKVIKKDKNPKSILFIRTFYLFRIIEVLFFLLGNSIKGRKLINKNVCRRLFFKL